jgi:hypothetical protein
MLSCAISSEIIAEYTVRARGVQQEIHNDTQHTYTMYTGRYTMYVYVPLVLLLPCLHIMLRRVHTVSPPIL